MYRNRATTWGALLLAWGLLVLWQWNEYRYEWELARQTVADSAQSVMNALVGGIRSHRRLGQFFTEQVQGVLEGVVGSQAVRAAALVAEEGTPRLAAGELALLEPTPPFVAGGSWLPDGYRLVQTFRLPEETAGPGGGRGRGRRWQMEDSETPGGFAPGTPVAAILVLDRSSVDRAIRRAAWTRGAIVGAGWFVLLSVALLWRSSVRLAEARGHTRILETEARHLRDLSQAAAGLAHETRNPLGLIRGWTQRLIEDGVESHDGHQQVQAVLEECDRVTARINQFLAFARPCEPKWERFDPAGVLDELAILLEPDLTAKQLTLVRPAAGQTVLADRELLRQALFNLLQNAIQASPEGGAIETAVREAAGGRRRIEVADRGPGVAAEAVEKLFTPYFTTRPTGTGLGLAIVRRLAAAHGWEVGYTPRPGGGAIFWLDGNHG